jgi:hypothetical protein
MTIKELCEACSEYDHNLTKISLAMGNIEGNKKYAHLKWAIDRDKKILNKLIDRQTDIREMIQENNPIIF